MLTPLTLVEAETFRQIQHAFYKGRRQHAMSLIEHAPHNVQLAVEYIRPEKKETSTVNDAQIAAIQLKAQQFIRQYMLTGTVAHEFQSLINERIEFGWITEDVSETAIEYYNLFWKENSELEESEEET